MLQEGPFLWATALLASGSIALAAFAQDAGNHEGATPADVARVIKPEFSPYAGRSFPTRPLFGDTHLHTAISVDAGTMNRVGQEDAFRFARGEEVVSTGGLRARLGRPLDFLVISDHAEMYGLMPQLLSGDPEVLATEAGQRWYSQLTGGDRDTIFATAMEIVGSLSGDEPPIKSEAAVRNAWQAYTALADRYNDPGTFATIIGFEWTAIGGYNLHRNVLFRGDAGVADQTLPFSQYDSQNPEDLWTYMEAFEERTGTEVLAIPHNGNLSNGRMFTVESFDGEPLTAGLAARRIRFEPLIEATQIKGDGEVAPVPVACRRIRRLRNLGPLEPERHRGQDARDAEVRIRPRGAEDRAQARERARGQPLQVRHGRLDQLAHLALDRRGGELLRQALGRRARAAPLGACGDRGPRSRPTPSTAGSRRRAASPSSGRRRTPAKRSSTPCSARRPTPPPALG